jgi:hypothetical protein
VVLEDPPGGLFTFLQGLISQGMGEITQNYPAFSRNQPVEQ